MADKPKSSSVTRTLRLDSELDSLIQNDAEKLGMSTNAMISKILTQYRDALRFDEFGYWIKLAKGTFVSMIEQLSIEEIEDIAYEQSIKILQVNLMMRGMKVNHETVLWYTSQILGEYSGWFKCHCSSGNEEDSMHLSHYFGRKWSHFLANYLSNIYHNELGAKVQTVVMDNDVHLTIMK